MLRMEWFIKNYVPNDRKVRVLDVGSYDVNGSYRGLFPLNNVEYVGLDMAEGPNVDYVPTDPYSWHELSDDSFDFIISGNAFEHIEYPWLTIKQMYQKLKNNGFACVLAPCTMVEHRYPVDCYRYFSDGFAALAKWAGFQIVNITVSGVPNMEVEEDWYQEGTNDTMMILTKNSEWVDVSLFPKLNYEKRTRSANEWAWRYYFIFNWYTMDKKAERFNSFFSKEGIKEVYLYGYGDIGKLMYNELKMNNNIRLSVIDQKGGIVDNCKIIKTGRKIHETLDACIIIAVLDTGIKEFVESIYKCIRVFFPNEVLGY